jgi:hypothetical protein
MDSTYKIYCDLDGVLVDFNKGYYDLTGIDIGNTHRSDAKFFAPINKAGVKFWNNLEWMSDGKELWDYIKKYEPELLSAPTRDYTSIVGKKLWVRRELPGVRLILRSAKHKKEFASPNSILIDDRIDNIKDWIDAGGIAIHHKNTKDTLTKLKNLNL